MGLDMYLYKRGKKIRDAIDINEVSYGHEEVAYWRKCNQIHGWFLDVLNLPSDFNCKYAEVTREDLQGLIDDCKRVLDDHDLAEEVLPVCEGFFFGCYEYDQYYFEELEDTIKKLTAVVENTDWDNEVVEYSCWW